MGHTLAQTLPAAVISLLLSELWEVGLVLFYFLPISYFSFDLVFLFYFLAPRVRVNDGRGYMVLSQTSFSLYLHNQWTDFHKLSCARKPQMRVICICVGCTKVKTNNWDIRLSVAVKALSANISWTAEQIHTIELVLESAH